MIELLDVTFTYDEATTPSVSSVSLHIYPGETVVLCGESGCGKSTLTRLINGLIPHFHEGSLTGEVRVRGRSVSDTPLYELSDLIGSVFQNPKTQFYNVNSSAELAFGCENRGLPPEEIERSIARTAARLGLEDLLDRSLFSMSGGEKQRIACGSVDVTSPEVMVLDEPSSNLDPQAIRELARVIRQWQEDGKTLVIAEHRIFYLMDIADRFIYIKDGRVEKEFTSDELRELALATLNQLGLRAPDPWMTEPMADFREPTDYLRLDSASCVTKGRTRLSVPELSLPRGEMIAVVGRNGAGKTTLARTLCGLEKSGTGELRIGATYTGRARRGQAYMVMQDVNHQLFTEDTISELIVSMEGSDGLANHERATEILRELDLEDKAERHPMSLSGGEKQRVAIGSAIAAQREILVLDEPTSGLDLRRMTEVAEALRRVSALGTTILIITHDIELVLRCCSHVVCLAEGRVVQSFSMAGNVERLREFFG